MSLAVDHSAPPAPLDPTSLLVAWLERRLHATTDWLLDEARLYGVTLRDADLLGDDADTAARFCLLDRGYPYDLLEGPSVQLAHHFDAVALLTLGWQAPYDPESEVGIRPSRHPHRVRVRVVALVRIDPEPGAAAVASAVRTDAGDAVVIRSDGGGAIVDALRNLAAEAIAVRETLDTSAPGGK